MSIRLARFLREARAAAAFDHPNICTIHEIGSADGQTFLAMAYVEGTTVSDSIHSLEINPNLAIAHYFNSWTHVTFGRMEEAIKEHKRAQELDPLTPLHTAWLGEIYRMVGRYDEAIKEANKSIEIDPKFPIGHFIPAEVHSDQGRHEEAITAYKKAAEVAPPWNWAAGVGYARAGRLNETRKLLTELEQQKVTPWNAYWRAF